MTRGRLICLVGPDGVGKTTQARLLAARLRGRGLRVKYLWLRFSHLFSLPILGLARILGLSEQVTYENSYRVGYHYLEKSALLSLAYEVTRIADFWLAYLLRARLWAALGWVVVCDRFFPDVVADLRLSTGRLSRFMSSLWLRIRGRMPKGSKVILLQAPEDVLRKRRPDLRHDRTLDTKTLIYRELREELGLTSHDATCSPDDLEHILESELLTGPESDAESRSDHETSDVGFVARINRIHHDFVKGPQPLTLGRAALVVGSSWLFQGMFYAGRTEIVFRLMTEATLLTLAAYSLAFAFPVHFALIAGWAIAHSANWVLNGQPVVALKNTGKVRTPPWQFAEYIAGFEGRAKSAAYLRYAAMYGSGGRGALSEGSDLDIKVVRRGGLGNALRSMAFLVSERARSTLKGFPLDIYVLDSEVQLRDLEGDAEKVVLLAAH